jgi:hypothetical protein
MGRRGFRFLGNFNSLTPLARAAGPRSRRADPGLSRKGHNCIESAIRTRSGPNEHPRLASGESPRACPVGPIVERKLAAILAADVVTQRRGCRHAGRAPLRVFDRPLIAARAGRPSHGRRGRKIVTEFLFRQHRSGALVSINRNHALASLQGAMLPERTNASTGPR